MPIDAPQEPESPEKWSRYQRVKAILSQAQGPITPSYQGYGRFWDLPLNEFLAVTLYGVPLIAPPPQASPFSPPPALAGGSCCHGPAPPAAAPASGSSPGRGAASGLIRGLRGQCPFDGTQFPRLPWDGQAVSEADILFIQSWIDDGCPETDVARSPVQVQESLVAARARGDEEHPLVTVPANQYHEDEGGIKARKNINSLTCDELRRLRSALATMMSFDEYYQDKRSFAYWARIHGNDCQHGWEEFLPWHRPYLYYFELQLQDIDPSVTLPYWDWTDNYDSNLAAQANPSASTDNGIIPEAFRCWLDEDGWNRLSSNPQVSPAALAALKKVVTVDPCQGGNPKDFMAFNSGLRLFSAAGLQYGQDACSDDAIMAELAHINPLWHRLRWPGGSQATILDNYPSACDVERILQGNNFFTFGSGPMNNHFFGALENLHNFIHSFSGGTNPNYPPKTPPGQQPNPLDRTGEPQSGDMNYPGVTAFDPIFWGHHSNVDRLWTEWQSLHPNVNPDNLTAELPPWPLNVQQTLSVANFGYEYLKESHVYPTENSVPVAKFKSAKTPVALHVLNDHRRAEVRLHKVKYRAHGGFHVRVFLNSQGADANTPTRGNDHYVGTISTFFGYCVGGPGHCDPPPETRRKFDFRPRHNKTPGNYRLDATDVVNKLKAQGETSFQVNLVVLNTDGTPAHDALLMNAVSLNFIE